MQQSVNEAFAENMVGMKVRFDVQPYCHGVGIISKCTPRVITAKRFMMDLGRVEITYEVFDVVVNVLRGARVGALSAGVPVPGTIHDMIGRPYDLTGLTFGELSDATRRGKTIVIARCG